MYNATTGEVLWSFQTGAGANSTATVFEHDGKEYVAFYAAGNALIGSAHGDNVWLFGLDGTLDEVTAAGGGEQGEHAGEEGSEQTVDGTGGNGGPDLTKIPTAKDLAAVKDQVRNGGSGMPAFGDTLDDAEIESVSEHVVDTINGGG